MKKILRNSLLLLTGLLIVTSCNKEELTQQLPELNLAEYSLLKEALANDLNYMANELRNIQGERSKIALDIAKNYYGANSRQFDLFNQSAELILQSSSGRTSSQITLTDFQQTEVNKIIAVTETLSSILEFKEYLNDEFTGYAKSDISIEDKNFMLTFISSFEVSFEFITLNPGLFQGGISTGRIQGFWGCVGGIAGAVATTTAVVGAIVTPPLWVLGASGWSLVVSAGAASAVTIFEQCFSS